MPAKTQPIGTREPSHCGTYQLKHPCEREHVPLHKLMIF